MKAQQSRAWRKAHLLWLCGLSASMCVSAAHAAGERAAEGTVLDADSLQYNQQTNTYTATGDAQMLHGTRTVRAKKIDYTPPVANDTNKTGHVSLEGDVSVAQQDDKVAVRADTWQSNQTLTRGQATNLHARIGKTVRLAARKVDFDRNAITTLDNAIYTPCGLCSWADAPLWSVRSRVITNDEAAGVTIHTDPTFLVAGVPVLQLPYLEHPSPSVKRRTGVLPPSIAAGRNNGFGVKVPYYFALAPDKDFTLTTTAYSSVLPLLDGEYRQRWNNSALALHGYGTYSDVVRTTGQSSSEQWRGALAGRLEGRTTQGGLYDAEVMRASDDTFLRRYSINHARALHSRFNYAQGIANDGQYSIAGDIVQSMVAGDDDKKIPMLLPLVEGKKALGTDALGVSRTISGSFAALNRLDGRDVQRVSGAIAGEKKLGQWQGINFSAFDDWRLDGYRYTAGNGSVNAGTVARVLPAAGVRGRLPIYGQHSNGWRDVFEITGEAIAAPYGGNNKKIPIEDNLTSTLDTLSLFGTRRLYGLDIAETGHRMNLGVTHHLQQADFGTLSTSVAQTYRLKQENILQSYGLGDKRSDYITRFTYDNPKGWRVWHAMRSDKDSLALKTAHSAVEGRYGVNSATLTYSTARQNADPNQPSGYQDLGASVTRQWTPSWSTTLSQQNNLMTKKLLERRLNVSYTDECLISQFFIARNYTQDRDLSSGVTFGMTVQLIPLAADAVPILKELEKEGL